MGAGERSAGLLCSGAVQLPELKANAFDAGLQGFPQVAVIGLVQQLHQRLRTPVQVVAGEQLPDEAAALFRGHGAVCVLDDPSGHLRRDHQDQVGIELLGGGVVGQLGVAG